MSVQYKAVFPNPPLHIVLYCLTPVEFRRYSSLTLCLPYPAWGENNGESDDASIELGAKGIRVVNTGRWPICVRLPRDTMRVSSKNPTPGKTGQQWGTPFILWKQATDHWS